ncbi:uncharacterized protein LOC143021652 [Oratosquilla oratoria]|uniref:uncharacterized protein LOC143021652 n=1 Tax=Oratosquilla oratoria TaxID=337810 RepID=UPI003F76A097
MARSTADKQDRFSNLEVKKVFRVEIEPKQTDTVDPVMLQLVCYNSSWFKVMKGNSAVRKVLSKYVNYRRFKSPTITQEMTPLPVDRANVNQKPVFVTGVDCFGPFFVKRARSQIKRYGLLFTCLSIRAIHLEVLHDLTAESMINALISRPLTVISSDVYDLCPITPNSLLNLDTSVVALESQEILCKSRKKWRQVQYLAKEFWRRWQKEYLPCLQERQKWLKVNRDLKEGDVVLMVENNTPRSHWLLAKVMRVIESKDGLIIQVEIARGKILYKRPISKLILLLEGHSE